MTLDVAVLICTRNRAEMLESCLESILACTPAPAEVVVVDQSRDELTRQMVSRHQGGRVPVRYLRGKGTGLSRAKNQGASDCTASCIAFTDDDCRVDPDWVAALTEPLRRGEAVAAAGRTLPGRSVGDAEETFSVYSPGEKVTFTRKSHPWRVGGGGNFAVTRSALERVGPFDERFGPGAPLRSAEDMDLVHRLLRAGERIVYVPEALVWHRSWRSPRANRQLSRAYGIGAGAYFTKYLFAGDLLSGWRFAQRMGVRSYHLARGALRGDGRQVMEQAMYLLGLIEGAGRFLISGFPSRPALPRLERERA